MCRRCFGCGGSVANSALLELVELPEMRGLIQLTWTTEDPEHYAVFVTVAPAADSAGRLGRVKGSLRRSEFSDRVAPLTRPAPSLCPGHYRRDSIEPPHVPFGDHSRRKSPAIAGRIGSRMPQASMRSGSRRPAEESEFCRGTASDPRATPDRVVGRFLAAPCLQEPSLSDAGAAVRTWSERPDGTPRGHRQPQDLPAQLER
jgi:hypothetical protein